MSASRRTVELPEDLCCRLEEKFGKSFASFEELLVYVIDALARDRSATMDAAEQEILEQRLRDLGYL